MVRINECEVIGLRPVSFTGRDGETVQGCYINCTYELTGSNDLGLGVVSVYASGRYVSRSGVTIGSKVRVARTRSGYELAE